MKIILVTGGAGFIGSYVCRSLIEGGYKVVVYDAFIQYVSPFESKYQQFLNSRFLGIKDNINFVRGDIRDKNDIRRTLEEWKPNVVIHLANLPIADLSFTHTEEAISSILNSAVNILDVIKEKNYVERFVYASSSMVYGDFIETPISEEALKRPKDIYGGTKLAAEILIETYGRRYGVRYTIVRPSAVYGPLDVNRRVAQIFIENALASKKITLHGGGGNALDFSFVEDVAEGIALASLHPRGEGQIFNITRGEGRSLLELVEILKGHFPNLDVEVKEMQLYRPKRGALSIKKARELLGYSPKFSLESGIERYVHFMKGISEV